VTRVRRDLRTNEKVYQSFVRVNENGISVATETDWFCLNAAETREVYLQLKQTQEEEDANENDQSR